jgi:hypothetical protein
MYYSVFEIHTFDLLDDAITFAEAFGTRTITCHSTINGAALTNVVKEGGVWLVKR